MNIVLLEQHEWLSNEHPFELTIQDRRAWHITHILNAQIHQTIRIGLVNGPCGEASVAAIQPNQHNSESVTLQINPLHMSTAPATASPVKLIVALPRPKTARRLVRTATELGIKEIHFINSYKVEKSYWQSPLLSEAKLNEQIRLGLEQSRDTVLPNVQFHTRFKPFIEDCFPVISQQQKKLLAIPESSTPLSTFVQANDMPLWVVVGPEGGFTAYENQRLIEAGCLPVNLGSRVLRTETVIPLLAGILLAAQQ